MGMLVVPDGSSLVQFLIENRPTVDEMGQEPEWAEPSMTLAQHHVMVEIVLELTI